MNSYLLRLLLVAAVSLAVHTLVRILYCKQRQVPRNLPREILLALFVLFVAELFALLFSGPPGRWHPVVMLSTAQNRLQTGAEVNLVPFRTIQRFMRISHSSRFTINVIGNIVMFVPLGFCLPLFWRRWQRWWKLLLFALLFPIGVESVQFFIASRSVDVDDVLLNFTGILLGCGLFLLLHLLAKQLPGLAALLGRFAVPHRAKQAALPHDAAGNQTPPGAQTPCGKF